MASRDEDRFRVKPGAPKGGVGDGSGQRSQRLVSQVLKQVSKAGANASGGRGARPSSTFGRGRVAADRAGQTLTVTARRVVIKSRYVVLKKAGAKSVSTHLRYIERDGVTRDGERGQAYGPETDTVDLKTFEERGKGDRHQFRFIVSVEDASKCLLSFPSSAAKLFPMPLLIRIENDSAKPRPVVVHGMSLK